MATIMSTSPPSSSSSSANSPDPNESSYDLGPELQSFDTRSDPFDFLLQSMVQNSGDVVDSSSSHANSPPDWSQLSAWAASASEDGQYPDIKYPDLGSDFNFSLPMDLDFDAAMAVDPTALHFNPSLFSQPDQSYMLATPLTSEMLSAPMFSSDNTGWTSSRRLSVTSSSSSSGASLSNISPISSSPASDGDFAETDPAVELAQRVRQMAGVTLAVPVSEQVQQLAAAGGQAKLPIPRLPRPPAFSLKSVSGQSSPSASPTLESASASVDVKPTPGTAVMGRPKTSHTTIERRYRTNLNARITALKQAVPALRVLEQKGASANVGGPAFEDLVDDRGFADGVKVARKMSKANVLGKATEYIRVLKKREARLKREQDGLKSLIGGLVGGAALVKEWEREWRAKFGGEEKDEIEDEGDLAGAGSDDEDGDGEDSGDDDEEGRARKKAKVVKAPKKEKPIRPPVTSSAVLTPGQMPEKRKRGRPRKVQVPLSADSVAPPVVAQDHSQSHPQLVAMQQDSSSVHQGQPTQQYLLAAFAFFSVFNSPFSSYSQPRAHPGAHTHYGTVLTPNLTYAAPPPSSALPYGYEWHHLAQALHLFVSTLVLFYVLVPWLSGTRVALSLLRRFQAAAQANVKEDKMAGHLRAPIDRATLTEALAPEVRGAADEAARLREALGVTDGVIGLMQGVIKAGRIDRGIELNQLEQRAWVRLGELIGFDATVSWATRLQTYWCMSWHISTFSASTSDLSTLALIIRPVSSAKAAALWATARKRDILRPHERLVLTSMSVDDAAAWLARWRAAARTKGRRCPACEKRAPLGILAAILIRERLRRHAAALFVRTVRDDGCRSESDDGYHSGSGGEYEDAEKECREEQARRDTVEAGRSIGGRTAEMAVLLERIWSVGTGVCEEELPAGTGADVGMCGDEDMDELDCEDEHDLASRDEAEIRALLNATMVYRKVFPSSFMLDASSPVSVILSPPPSPGAGKSSSLHAMLRAFLGTPAFEADSSGNGRLEDESLGVALEEARDRVVDMLVDVERAGKWSGRA